MTGTLAGRTALITGATAGIGLETARLFLRAGATVVLNGRDPERGRAALASLAGDGDADAVRFVAGDVRAVEDCLRLVALAGEAFGPLGILVHAAGIGITPKPFQRAEASSFRPLIEGHLLSAYNICHAAVPALIAAGGGSIVTVASDAGKVATPGEAIIGSLKAAVIMFTRGLALELSRHGIRANCITPSFVVGTPANERMRADDFMRKVVEKADSRARLGPTHASDLAELALFLAGPGSSRITGQAISVNGGISAA